MKNSHIGKYKIISTLGKGGMGIVYHAIDELIEREVAIKIIHSHLIHDDTNNDFLQRFVNEAKTAVRCSHPNIVTILEYGEQNGIPYLVMEYLKGHSLAAYFKIKKAFPLKVILNITIQILKALSFAHQKDVVHRDIKPANILLLADNLVKLTDFGIARLSTSDLTQKGSVLGSIRYMPPEQALGNAVSGSADLFSVGVIFSQLLAQSTYADTIETAKLVKISGLSEQVNVNFDIDYPKPLIPILRKSLQPFPENRYQTADEFIQALQQACHLPTNQTAPVKPLKQIKMPKPQAPQTKPLSVAPVQEDFIFYQWDQRLSVGIPSIDRQHKVLISLINELHISIEQNRGKFQAKHILKKIIHYARSHFIYEESLFKRVNYIETAEHIKSHQRISETLADLKADSSNPHFDLPDVLMTFLKDWLNNHILIEDMGYSELLISHNIR